HPRPLLAAAVGERVAHQTQLPLARRAFAELDEAEDPAHEGSGYNGSARNPAGGLCMAVRRVTAGGVSVDGETWSPATGQPARHAPAPRRCRIGALSAA